MSEISIEDNTSNTYRGRAQHLRENAAVKAGIGVMFGGMGLFMAIAEAGEPGIGHPVILAAELGTLMLSASFIGAAVYDAVGATQEVQAAATMPREAETTPSA